MRAFVDWMIDGANKAGQFDGSVAVIQPLKQGIVPQLNQQHGRYTVLLRGLRAGKPVENHTVVRCIAASYNPYDQWAEVCALFESRPLRYVVSNTTEAGIVYVAQPQPAGCPDSFPAKVAALLCRRHAALGAAANAGLCFLPCELIDRNGDALQQAVVQHLADWGRADVAQWVEQTCTFCSTLVDRIVTGYPHQQAEALCRQWGYQDKLIVAGEDFHQWVIQAPEGIAQELAFLPNSGFQVQFTSNLAPYRERKVRLLNGCHTLTVPVALLAGVESVRQAVEHADLGSFMQQAIALEILPGIALPDDQKQSFADAVLERFANPYIHHLWSAIALNSLAKWPVRVLPSLIDAQAAGRSWRRLAFSLAALLRLYRAQPSPDGYFVQCPGSRSLALADHPQHLAFFAQLTQQYPAPAPGYVYAALGNADIWGQDLTALPDLAAQVADDYQEICKNGILPALRRCCT